MIRAAIPMVVIVLSALISAGEATREPETFFREKMGLSDDQIAAIDRGHVVAKVLNSKTPAEIFVFGAVFLQTSPERCVSLAFDPSRLRRLPSYLGIGRFSDPPKLSDLKDFTLEPEDVRSLKSCRPGKCAVQLPAEAMMDLRDVLDRAEPDAATQVNDQVRRRALEVLLRYREEGNRVLGTYRDTERPFDVEAQLQSWMGRAAALTGYLPELNRYLLEYPNAELAPNMESFFYWEKVNFGLKPTLRLNHAMAYRSSVQGRQVHIFAVKQLYASHYFQLALDLTACIAESGSTSRQGSYLISLRGSTQQGFTGFKGSLLRMIVVGRTRSAQEKALIAVKTALDE